VPRSRHGRSLSPGDSIWLLARLFDDEDGVQACCKVTFSIAFGEILSFDVSSFCSSFF
jgi:hypothetical protein